MAVTPSGKRLAELPPSEWPAEYVALAPKGLTRVLLSGRFLVQEFAPVEGGAVRLTVNRVKRKADLSSWQDGITWDELQRLKTEAGYGDAFAVEVYPADEDLVAVANMRHLWVLPEPPPFAWRRGGR